MPYKLHSSADDCYPGTFCLINKYGIRDEKELSLLESGITAAKSIELLQNPFSGKFDFDHLKAIHKYLFDDLYEWAGKIRTVNLSGKGTSFADAADIEYMAENCFRRLKEENYFLDLPFDQYAEQIADFYNVLNMIHPFREGNGRTQRCFMTQLIQKAGYDIDFSEIDSDELMIATIYAAQGIKDLMVAFFQNNLSELEEQKHDTGMTFL